MESRRRHALVVSVRKIDWLVSLLMFRQTTEGSALTTESSYTVMHRLTVASFLESAPALKFSSFRSIRNQDVLGSLTFVLWFCPSLLTALVSLPTLVSMNDNLESCDDIPIRRLLIQLKDGVSYSLLFLSDTSPL